MKLEMKFPKSMKRYCPKCVSHTEQKVSSVKRKSPSSLSYGSKKRAKLRGRARGKGNRGRYSKPAVTKFKMTGKKQSKKTDLRYQCGQCNKTTVQKEGFRIKKLEFV